MKRIQSHSTWVRFGVLLALYLLTPLVAEWILPATETTTGKAWEMVTLFTVFPLVTLALAARDGFVEGFSVLWAIAPITLFVAPMLIFFNSSALIYGAAYSILAILASGIGNLVRARSHA